MIIPMSAGAGLAGPGGPRKARASGAGKSIGIYGGILYGRLKETD